MKLTSFFEPVSNLSKRQKIFWLIFYMLLFLDLIVRMLTIESLLVQSIIDSVLGIYLISFL